MSRAALCLKEGNKRKYCGEITMKARWSYVKKTLEGSIVNWITFVLGIISISLDPFTCYVPSIDDEEKKLKINSSLLISIWVLYWSLLIYRISISFCTENKRTWRVFNQAESIALLCSNVLYSLIFITKMDISAPVFSVVLGILLVVYLARIIGIYRLFKENVTRSASGKLAEAPIIKIGFGFNFLLFLYGSHLFGGLWYLLAVWKKIECWKKACSNHDGCQYANNRFNVGSGDNKFLDDICFAKTEDTKPYEVGIFKDAIESRIVETTTELRKKLLYCLRWGIQNISGFGQNLQVSTYAWENIFVILIAIYGLGTFTYFVGNMQVERFRRWSDKSLRRLCDCFEPIVYAKHTHIVREGDPINKMLFVLNGKLVARSRNNVSSKEIYKGGDFWGEELVDCKSFSSSSTSKKLISLTKVEAFVLRIDDLKKLYNEKAKIIQSWFRLRQAKRQNNARCCGFGNLSLCRYRCGP